MFNFFKKWFKGQDAPSYKTDRTPRIVDFSLDSEGNDCKIKLDETGLKGFAVLFTYEDITEQDLARVENEFEEVFIYSIKDLKYLGSGVWTATLTFEYSESEDY